jgi:hypothetical protein
MIQFPFASSDALQSASQYMRNGGSSSGGSWQILIILGIIALLCGGLYLWDRVQKKRRVSGGSPTSLFAELVAAHGLNRSERALLLQGATQSGLDSRSMMFVDPEILGRLAQSAGAEAQSFAALKRKLFGSIDETEAERDDAGEVE